VIDRFFDAVLVNCDDPILRRNRHALLSEVREQFLRFADISMVVIESSNGE
jgi:glycyl-tRNA synthetase beta chain